MAKASSYLGRFVGIAHNIADPPMTDEIRSVVFSMDHTKAPEPDRVDALFNQHAWPVCGPAVCTMIQVQMRSPDTSDELADSCVVMIPKKPNPTSCGDLRPIAQRNVDLKILSKLLVERLKPFLSSRIDPVQSAFIPGRKIADNIILVQEIMHSMRSSPGRRHWAALKADLSKAFDRIGWCFIRDTLERL